MGEKTKSNDSTLLPILYYNSMTYFWSVMIDEECYFIAINKICIKAIFENDKVNFVNCRVSASSYDLILEGYKPIVICRHYQFTSTSQH